MYRVVYNDTGNIFKKNKVKEFYSIVDVKNYVIELKKKGIYLITVIQSIKVGLYDYIQKDITEDI